MAGFSIFQGKGFHITFDNGVKVSVQFGPYNYCGHHNVIIESLHEDILKMAMVSNDEPKKCDKWTSQDAEIAIIGKNNEWLTRKWRDEGDDVIGYVTPDDVLEALTWAKNYKGE